MTAILASLIVLIGGAAASVLLARAPRAGLFVAMSAIGVAAALCTGAALPILLRGADAPLTTLHWPLPVGSARLALDALSAWFLVTISVVSLAVAVYAWGYMQAEMGRQPVPAFGALLCTLVAALTLVTTADDAVLFLFGWEGMTLAAFFLVAFHHRRADVRHAAWVYLIATHLATGVCVLPMFGLLVARTGSSDFATIRTGLQSADAGLCVWLFVLGLIGFGTKAGFMPMHIWLPVAHPAAPTPVSALLSGVVIKVGIYALLRLLSWLPGLPPGCAILMLVVAMISGVLGVLYALAQHDVKRLLAYHSVENIGIIGLGIGMGMLGQSLAQPALIALGYGGALLHVLNHALFKGLLFLSAGAAIHATGTGDIERLGGLAKKTPINAALFLVAAVSICGLPPFNGFVSEWILYGSLVGGALSASRASAGAAVAGAVSLALMGGLALACFAKVFGVVFLGQPRDASIRAHSTPPPMVLGMLLPAALCAAIGLLPAVFVPLTSGAVGAIAGTSAAEFARATQSAQSAAARLSLLAAVLLAAVLLLAILRRAALRRNASAPAASAPTWGCAYAAPSPRMQYTASSFAGPLIQSFRHALWPERTYVAPAGTFAATARLESHTPDLAEHDLFSPLLRGVGRFFRMIRTLTWSGEPAVARAPGEPRAAARPLRVLTTNVLAAMRHGRVHVYMAFIVVTLLVVFLVEAFTRPTRASMSRPAPPSAAAVDGAAK